MADETDIQQPIIQPIILDPVAAQQKAISEAAAEAERKQADETEPGGRYKVNGVYVNALGEKHKNQKD